MDEFKVVAKTELPRDRRHPAGRFARIFIELQKLKKAEALAVTVKDKKDGAAVKKCVGVIVRSEKPGYEVMHRRSDDGTTFYFWLELKGEA